MINAKAESGAIWKKVCVSCRMREHCRSGGMVYTCDSKSHAARLKGSSPFSGTHMGFGILTRYIRLLAKWRAIWLAKQIRELFPAGSSLLNVGAGEGMLETELIDAGYIMTSLEPDSANQPHFIKEKFESATFSSRFDGIIFSYSLHHIDAAGDNIKKALGLLSPGGKLLIMEIATKNTLWRWLTLQNRALCSSRTHAWTQSELARLIETSGGTITKKISYRTNAVLFVVEARHA